MARRAPGDGSVFYDAARGRWVGQVSLGRDPRTGRRVRRKVTAPTRSEVRDKLDELREEKRKTGTVARRDVTVRQVVGEWLANPPPEVRSQITRECHRHAAGRLPDSLLRTPLVRLTPGQVETALAGLVRQGYATRTIGMSRSVLARSIRRAQRDGLVARNVAELVPCPRGTVRTSRSMTVAQVEALLSSSSSISPWLRGYVYTGIMCGLRPGELLGLRWEDVDLEQRVIRVRTSVKLVTPPGGTKRPSVEDLKTDRSRRTMVMPAAVAAMLGALRRDQAAARLRAGAAYAGNGLVFPAGDGRPCWPEVARARFQALCRQAGLGGDWHPHEMRHSFVSILSDSGVDIDRIADAAGHINSNVTKTVYRHVLADKLATAAAVMDATFRASGGAS
ncbi:MAG TPA: site-specific integrase [Streptosporangiaceae bacterium]|jgi:integrase